MTKDNCKGKSQGSCQVPGYSFDLQVKGYCARCDSFCYIKPNTAMPKKLNYSRGLCPSCLRKIEEESNLDIHTLIGSLGFWFCCFQPIIFILILLGIL
jgi:hypothetical protein